MRILLHLIHIQRDVAQYSAVLLSGKFKGDSIIRLIEVQSSHRLLFLYVYLMPRNTEYYDDIDPAVVLFTHSSIRPFFSCGRRVTDTLEDIKSRKLKAVDLPKILIYRIGDDLFSMNNRRLYVLKALREQGIITTVNARIRIIDKNDKIAKKYTRDKCALKAKFMREGAEPRDGAQQASVPTVGAADDDEDNAE